MKDCILYKKINNRTKKELIEKLLKDFPPSITFDISKIKRKWIDIPYASLLPKEKLDIYLPDEKKEAYPVIVWLHGGAWIWGHRRDQQLKPIIEGIKMGYAVVSVGYSLSDDVEFPTSVYEVKSAIRWIRAHSDEYHLDPDKIILWGASAGAHLACLAGLSSRIGRLDELSFGNSAYSSEVQAVVDWCGPINLWTINSQNKENGYEGIFDKNDPDLVFNLYMGDDIRKMKQRVDMANPETYIAKNSPYVYIQHGMDDNQIPRQQSLGFADKLKRKSGEDRVKLALLEDVGHHGSPEFESREAVYRVFDFLGHVLNK